MTMTGPTNSSTAPKRRGLRLVALVAVLSAAGAALITGLLVSIVEKKQEAKNPFFRVVELTDETDDPVVWGKNFPLQYDGYLKTADIERTRYGGSEALPHVPSSVDPRGAVTRSKIDDDPRLKTLWAGYAFSIDYREKRGHAYMLTDQMYTERQRVVKQPGTCINCHASTYVAMKRLGGGDLLKGFDLLDRMPYFDALKQVKHPVSCIDCHDPTTMALRVTKPAFIEGIRKVKALAGKSDFDVNRDATRAEMRTYVCGQCHVEYYFKGPEKRLTFPWDKGLQTEQILAYYDEAGFSDWTHKETGAKMLKVQHPEFETFNQGSHARAGVACADCHMPYMRVGATKVSDHWVRSPLLNINNSCQTCHRASEEELKARAEGIQGRHVDLRNHALNGVVDLVAAIKDARAAGATEAQLQPALDFQRKASWMVDWGQSENSTGFHAPQATSQVLGLSLDYSRQGIQTLAALWKDKAIGGSPPAVKPKELKKGRRTDLHPRAAR
jgi:nitrite reductase (cytochrome c-552)